MGAPVTTAVEITCPSWCAVEPRRHANDLWDTGARCLHHAEHVGRQAAVALLGLSTPEQMTREQAEAVAQHRAG